jgi:hypothetical protein
MEIRAVELRDDENIPGRKPDRIGADDRGVVVKPRAGKAAPVVEDYRRNPG